MLTWVRDGNIEVYCECIVEDAINNMNPMQNMDNAIDNMIVGSISGANLLAPLEVDKEGQHLHAVECSYRSSDYDISINSEEDEYEQQQEVKSQRRRRAEVEREACHLREDNEREDNVMEVND